MSFKINKNNLKGNDRYLYEMGFQIDPSNVGGGGGKGDFKPIEKGEYEVFPTVFEMSRSQSGNEMATFNYIIRDDVEQPFKGREIRYDRFVFTDNAMWRINQASVSAGLDGEFEDGKQWAEAFKNKAVRIFVDINDKGYPEVKNFKPSEVGGTRTEENNGQIDISDDELPF